MEIKGNKRISAPQAPKIKGEIHLLSKNSVWRRLRRAKKERLLFLWSEGKSPSLVTGPEILRSKSQKLNNKQQFFNGISTLEGTSICSGKFKNATRFFLKQSGKLWTPWTHSRPIIRTIVGMGCFLFIRWNECFLLKSIFLAMLDGLKNTYQW